MRAHQPGDDTYSSDAKRTSDTTLMEMPLFGKISVHEQQALAFACSFTEADWRILWDISQDPPSPSETFLDDLQCIGEAE